MNVLNVLCIDDLNEDVLFDFEISFNYFHVDYLISNLPDDNPSSKGRNASCDAINLSLLLSTLINFNYTHRREKGVCYLISCFSSNEKHLY